jgi:serine phosphatase RsbU (regulator of sigma subunit)
MMNQSRPESPLSSVDWREEASCHLEIRSDGEPHVRYYDLVGGRHVIGRNPELALVLDNDRVSRLHAELVLGHDERWWIHDLDSTNGTYVNGSRVSQRRLNADDALSIGSYSLVLKMPRMPLSARTQPPPQSTRRGQALIGETPPFRHTREDPYATRQDTRHGPTPLSVPAVRAPLPTTDDLLAAGVFGRELRRLEDKHARVLSLCDYVTGSNFPGVSAWVVALDRDNRAQVVLGPIQNELCLPATAADEQAVTQRLRTSHAVGMPVGMDGCVVAPQAHESPLITCVLESRADYVEIFCVQLPQFTKDWSGWPALIKLLNESYQHANEMSSMREQFRANARVDHELQMAREIQDRLVPRSLNVPGLELAIGYEPSQWVGGDYVDAVPMSDGRVLLTVADVCGKGLHASLVASSLHTLVHVVSDQTPSLVELVERVNRYLCKYLREDSFVTMVFVALNVSTLEAECINAGHLPVLLVNPKGEVRKMQMKSNVPLGMLPSTPVSETHVLSPDDLLLLYTDGLIETPDTKADMGMERLMTELKSIVLSAHDAPVEVMAKRLSNSLRALRGSMMSLDDTTMMVVRPRLDRVVTDVSTGRHATDMLPPPDSLDSN